MTMLLVQIFLLLLAAFLAGAATACGVRRSRARRRVAVPASAPTAGASGPAPFVTAGERSNRFDRALTGDAGAGVPLHLQATSRPMVEVQPAPAPKAEAKPLAAPEPAPAPQPPVEPVVAPEPASAPKVEAPPAAAPEPPSAPKAEAQPVIAPEPPSTSPPKAEAAPPAAASEPPATPKIPTPPQRVAVPITPPAPVPAPGTPRKSRFDFAGPPPVAPEPPAAPVATPAAPAAAPAEAKPSGDDLTRIRTLSPETQSRLNALGITTFRDIASWTADDIGRVSQALGYLGRVEEENWVGQAEILARGGDPGTLPPKSTTAAAPAGADRLHRIIGIDAETEQILLSQGITRFSEIASWTSSDIEKVERVLGRPGRVGLENWIGQAKVLARSVNGGAVPAVEPEASAADMEPTLIVQSTPQSRSDVLGLRSVRSAALRGDGPAAPPVGVFEDLKRIRGIGVLIEKKLNSLGVTAYEQIANWTQADIDRISQVLDFKGRIERESWVEQARILASGGQTDFSRRADRDEVETSRDPNS